MNIGTNQHPPPGGFLAELRDRLTAFASSLRLRRAHGDQLEAEVCLDVVADAARTEHTAARLAYSAQQSDLEAARLIRESLADGRITADEIPVLRHALRHVGSSARADERLTRLLPSA